MNTDNFPIYSDAFRTENLERAQTIMTECVGQYGLDATEYIVRIMFTGLYITSLAHGISPNLVLAEFDRQSREIRERIVMFANGKIKVGEIGPK